MEVFGAEALVSDRSPRCPERRAISAVMAVFIVVEVAVGRGRKTSGLGGGK